MDLMKKFIHPNVVSMLGIYVQLNQHMITNIIITV